MIIIKRNKVTKTGKPRKERPTIYDKPDVPFSFRLRWENEKEAEALEVFETWSKRHDARGANLRSRFIFTCALLALGHKELPSLEEGGDNYTLAKMLGGEIEDLKVVIAGLKELGFEQVSAPSKAASKKAMPTGYLKSLAKSFRGGQDEDEDEE